MSFFERFWGLSPSPTTAEIEPVPVPVVHPYRQLEYVIGEKLEAIERNDSALAEGGQRVGRVVEFVMADGTVTQRFRNYAHLIEAGVDARVAAIESNEGEDSQRARQARLLAPVAVRWHLMRARADLSDAEPSESASWGLKTRPAAPIAGPAVPISSGDGVGKGQEVREVRRQQQEAIMRRFADANEAKRRELFDLPNVDAFAQRMAISRELTKWAAENPDLDQECRIAEAQAAD